MSSRFAAAICAHLVDCQAREGIVGDFVELGVFEGRFFIALALALRSGEKAFAIDLFSWPDEGVLERFQTHCLRHGVRADSVVRWKTNSTAITCDEFKARLGDHQIRFAHIDAGHHRHELRADLELVHGLLHPAGVICVDDMLHPSYPVLIKAVFEFLEAHPEFRVLCVIDREDIVAAPKLLLCHHDRLSHYHGLLAAAFGQFRFYINADMEGYGTMVLTPEPLIIDIGTFAEANSCA